jgi:general secretion pathway protein A
VYKHSGGTPRVINAVCDRALLVGYTREEHTITPRLVRQAIKEVMGERPKARKRARRPSSWLRPKPTLFAAAVAAIAVVAVVNPGDGVWVNHMKGVLDEMWSGVYPATTAPDTAASATGTIAKRVENPSGDSDAKAPISSSGRNEVLAFATIPESTGENAGLLEPAATEIVVEPSPESPTALELNLPSRNAALKALLGAWKLGRLSPMPKTNTPEDLAQFAEANGLAYESLRLGLTELAVVNLPVLARVQSGSNSVWVALLGIRERAVILGNGSAEGQLVPRDQFEDAYSGDAMIMWLDPTPSRTPLALGTRGPAVLALQSSLNAFGFDSVETTGVYGAATQDAVRQIQASTGLQVDGVVGKQTRMVLTSWSRDEPTPSLGPKPFPIATRSFVADGNVLTGRALAQEEAETVAAPPASVEANALDVPEWLRNTGPPPGPN